MVTQFVGYILGYIHMGQLIVLLTFNPRGAMASAAVSALSTSQCTQNLSLKVHLKARDGHAHPLSNMLCSLLVASGVLLAHCDDFYKC
jgi:hypothetical protein